jgi:putative ABC transport system permease protein
MENLLKDLRYAFRNFLKSPGFTIVAVITLALGIGANTAIFSVVNGVLLRPLPYKEPDRLVWVWGVQPKLEHAPHSPADFLDYQLQNQSFEQMAATRNMSFTLTGSGQPERINGLIVSANYFSLLGVTPTIGRAFSPEEGKAGAARVAVLSHRFWQRRFNGDPSIVGQALTLNGESVIVAGVMPVALNQHRVELWLNPHQVVPDFTPTFRGDLLAMRNNNYLQIVARLKPDVTLQQAQADLSAIHARLEQQFPNKREHRLRLVYLQERIVGDLRPTLLMLLGAVGLVLLIACANVANLMLVRATARQREMAIRAALGASQWRLIRQLLVESVVLALLGGVCGWLLAAWGLDLLVALSPEDTPRLSEVGLDRWMLGFTLIISLLTGIVFGLAPALTVSRLNLNEELKEGGRRAGEGPGRQRIRRTLVTAEVTLALIVLVGAGLLVKSFVRLQAVNPGFNPAGVTTMAIWLSQERYVDEAPRRAFMKELIARLERLPGVEGVAIANDLPILGTDTSSNPTVEGLSPAETAQLLTGIHVINPNYFKTMGIPLLKGRAFTERDDEKAPPVFIVSETMARTLWPNQDAVGKRLKFGGSDDPFREVVGVVGDVKFDGLHEAAGLHVYIPQQIFPLPYMFIAVRSKLDVATLTTAVRHEVELIDPNQPISDIRTMDQVMAGSVATRQLSMTLFSLFGVIALLLVALGIYGVIAYSVTQRTHEIGIRIALGAQTSDVLKLVVVQGMKMTLVGVVFGLIGALMLMRLMKSLLFNVSATDPVTFLAIAMLLTVVALLASYIPARRAAKVDPMVALRYE